MDIDARLEAVYQSIIQKDNQLKQNSKRSLQNVSKLRRSYTPGSNQTCKIMSEAFLESRPHSAMSFYRLQNETIMIKSTKSEERITTSSQGEEILSVEEEIHQETNYAFSGPNCVTTIADEGVYQDDSKSECSQNTYQAVDGYQSGEPKMSDVQPLCKDCKSLYKKVRKRKQPAIIGDPDTTDPRPWYSKFWVFMNRVPARRSMKKLKRSLGSVLRRLGGMQTSRGTPSARIYWRCYRSHLFLKRNIRLHKEEQKKLFENEGDKKRKQPESGGKSRRPKKAVPSNQPVETESQRGKIARDTHSFVLDSSQEEETGPDIKRYKLQIKNAGRKSLKQRETLNSTSAACLALSPAPCSGPMTPLDEQGVTEPTGHDPILPSEYSLQIGSFREQLKNLNKGLLQSAIVNEN